MVRFPKLPNNPDPVIGYVAPNSPAAKAGIHEGDRIVQIDSAVDPTWEDVEMRTIASAQHNVDVWTERDGQRLHFTVTPKLDPKTGAGIVGWSEQVQIEVASLVPGMGAQKAGLQKGDVLEKVNGQPILSVEKLHDVIASQNGAPVDITYLRNGNTGHAAVEPRRSEIDGPERWMIGVQLTPRIAIEQLSFPAALGESVRQNAKGASMIYTMLKGIAEHKMSSKSLTGPIGIAQLSGEAAREGAGVFFGLMATVSLNLAILNLLPIPILDGGVIVLLLIEMFMRRDLSMRVREAVLKAGFVFLMAVVVFVLYNDITKLAG
jgi:regulator of sigma E protease